MSDRNNFDRNNTNDSDYQKVVDDLLRKQRHTKAGDNLIINDIKSRGNDADTTQKIFNAYKESKERTERRAKKFYNALVERYNNLTPLQIYEKAGNYKEKVGMSDAEFEMFRHLVFSQNPHAAHYTYNVPSTRIAKLFGFSVEVNSLNNELNVSATEEGVVQEILRMHAENKYLHEQVSHQAYGYDINQIGNIVTQSSYNKDFNNLYSFIHPVIVALFLPQIRLLEEHMLYASISNIVKLKHEGKPIVTRPDYMLLWDMMTDPNDAVCNIDSAIVDVKNRATLQVQLWKSVLNLRQGKIYSNEHMSFLSAAENCRVNMFDTPDLSSSMRDEGVVLRRLLSAFSLRPTIVETTPINFTGNSLSVNPYMPMISNPSMTMITSVPMIAVRLPQQTASSVTPYPLASALQQNQWFVQNQRFVTKQQNVIRSNNLIVFYVPRKQFKVDYLRRLYPHQLSSLPTHIAGTSDINRTPVNVPATMQIGNLGSSTKNAIDYYLTSAICVDEINVSKAAYNSTTNPPINIPSITGSKTYIFETNITPGTLGSSINDAIMYNPIVNDKQPSLTVSTSTVNIGTDLSEIATVYIYVNDDVASRLDRS
jgi:hypothetical protein